MTFRLSVDGPVWDQSLRAVLNRFPETVPVIKGNGYGFGLGVLAERSDKLGFDTVAIGVSAEAARVRAGFSGQILVLAPMQRTELHAAPPDPGLLRTVAHLEILDALSRLAQPPQVVLELESAMHRHGVPQADLLDLVPALRRMPLAGLALHLPGVGAGRRAIETALRSVARLRAAGIEVGALWVSRLPDSDLAWLRAQDPRTRVRLRVGTNLWLADRQACTATGAVLDVHATPRRQRIGYSRRRSPGGTVVVVSGGTSHGVGLQTAASRGHREGLARAAIAGAARAAGLVPSPFHWAGRRLQYADVPHMQVSMLLVPAGIAPPEIGDRLRCDVRMTLSTFDQVLISDPAQSTPCSRMNARVGG